MLTEYIKAAMATAVFEVLDDTPGVVGTLPPCQGVWANEPDEASCREELQSALEDWIVFRLSRGMELPEVAGLSMASPVLVS